MYSVRAALHSQHEAFRWHVDEQCHILQYSCILATWLSLPVPPALHASWCLRASYERQLAWCASWAAYVAGAILVLAHERNINFPDGLSLLLASAVPEGKGVSSSAAVEVAAMSAIAALHGLALSGRELALLCQKASEGVGQMGAGIGNWKASLLLSIQGYQLLL